MAKLTSDMTDKLVGQRIQKRRRELGMTAQQLSEDIDISQQQLSRYERGTNKINVAHLVSIATKLDTPIGWFFMDCFSENEKKIEFVPIKDIEIKTRLEQIWPKMSHEQRRVLVLFLDEYIK
ncbi:helix-turn-helix domain-containing protein [Pectobacterium carotovorum]|uniref:Helix-turn-helix transcriptional regulator n=1 Tax=Pectobacterium brasiliense TaxID=180957 RepID=A0AAW9HFZ5_9GAMM|nr:MULTISPECIES: helix-turn-helix transcriptional regulator [Pectobacterium]MCE9730784.1 transcriptional regulator [Pectobacterium sp. IFB5596]MDY4379334.1 helix-turn-helix transcriptional regulator [Pectobacterium brasiliense]